MLIQSKRFRGKINIQRPKPPHYERKLFNAVTEPVYVRTPIVVECREKQIRKLEKRKKEYVPHPYELILSRELREIFDTSEMVLICQKNSIKALDLFNFKVALHKKGVKVKINGKKILNVALKGTKFENLLPVMEVHPCMLFGDASSIGDILKILRKTPQMILLTGCMSDRILSRDQLIGYSKLPDLQQVRAQFAATLNSAGGQILNHLQAHQSNLCYLLDVHAKALGEATPAKSPTDDASQTVPETEKE